MFITPKCKPNCVPLSKEEKHNTYYILSENQTKPFDNVWCITINWEMFGENEGTLGESFPLGFCAFV